ncbi:DeoR family transcriptional regulator, partial [Kitasatospora sp. NPDC097643]|uniref:DeoR family transcriptional regulator n=1 Tax=Kitasatospora sp. NPDC097643 TaxID=3157230 RepID=UPI00331AAC16
MDRHGSASDARGGEHVAVSAEVRRAWITHAVRELGTVRVADLARHLGVPAVTLRRDIAALAREGLLRRSHGTVALPREAGRDASGSRTGVPAAEGRGRVIGMLVPTIGSYFDEVIAGAGGARGGRRPGPGGGEGPRAGPAPKGEGGGGGE